MNFSWTEQFYRLIFMKYSPAFHKSYIMVTDHLSVKDILET